MDIKRDDYIIIDITWKSGFKHSVPCRGFNLKSQIEFQKSIFWIESYSYRVVTKKEYEESIWGSLEAVDTELKTSMTSSASPRKRGTSQKKVGSDVSTTQASAKTAIKTTKEKATSSTRMKKKPSGLEKEIVNERRTRKSKTLEENPTKRKPRQAAGKDSKGIPKPKRDAKPTVKRASSSSKEARNELRKPKVPNVRKPKKDVQGTNDPGTKSTSGNGNRKRKTQ